LTQEAAEARFEDLAQEICRKAEAVQCSPSDYRDGLRHIIGELQTLLDAATPSKRAAPPR
jgi:hypothetical protein